MSEICDTMEKKSYDLNYPSLPISPTRDSDIIKEYDDTDTQISVADQKNTSITIYDLPFDMFCEITKFLVPIDLSRMRETSKVFKELVPKLVGYCYWSVQNILQLQLTVRRKRLKCYWYNSIHKICGVKMTDNLKLIRTPTHIKAGKYFPSNSSKFRSIKLGDIPSTVIILDLSKSRYNYTIGENSLSKNLEVLLFPNRFNKSLGGVLPHNLRVLVLGSNWNCGIPMIKGVPIHTNDIEIDKYVFPVSLETLVIKSIHFNIDIAHILGVLTNLKKLVLGSGYMHKLTYIPPNLQYLEVGRYYNHSLENIPKNIIVVKNT